MDVPLMEDSLGEEEFRAINSCLKSGEYTQGKLVDQFEKAFATWNGSKYAVMVNSGSSANLLMVYLLKLKYGLKEGDEVLVPAVTWPTTIYPVIQNNLVPVFCDVDKSFNISLSSMKKMATSRTKAVFVVHLLGQPAKMAEIREFCQKSNILIIEDCCESTGAKIGDVKVGNFGLAGSFSFYFAHHMTTIEGGMIVTDDFETYDLLKSARSHGWVRGSPREKKYPQFKNNAFLFDLMGYNLRSTNINAAIGLVQLGKLDGYISKRVHNHGFFLHNAPSAGLRYQEVHLDETSSFSFAVLCDSKEEKEYVMGSLSKKGVETRPIVAGNLLRQPVFKNFSFRKDKTVMADMIDDCGFYFANNPGVDESKIKYVLSSIEQALKEFRN